MKSFNYITGYKHIPGQTIGSVGMSKLGLDPEILEAMNEPLSDRELLSLVEGKANLLTYDEFAKYDNIDAALGKYGALIILYLTDQNMGHWTCVFRNQDYDLEFFDSYGYKPDDEFAFIPEFFRAYYQQIKPHLSKLLYDSGYGIIYNEHPLQSSESFLRGEDPPSTCGYWVACRLNARDKPLEQFVKPFLEVRKKHRIMPDYSVVALCLDQIDQPIPSKKSKKQEEDHQEEEDEDEDDDDEEEANERPKKRRSAIGRKIHRRSHA